MITISSDPFFPAARIAAVPAVALSECPRRPHTPTSSRGDRVCGELPWRLEAKIIQLTDGRGRCAPLVAAGRTTSLVPITVPPPVGGQHAHSQRRRPLSWRRILHIHTAPRRSITWLTEVQLEPCVRHDLVVHCTCVHTQLVPTVSAEHDASS